MSAYTNEWFGSPRGTHRLSTRSQSWRSTIRHGFPCLFWHAGGSTTWVLLLDVYQATVVGNQASSAVNLRLGANRRTSFPSGRFDTFMRGEPYAGPPG